MRPCRGWRRGCGVDDSDHGQRFRQAAIVNIQKLQSVLQIVGAALGIPAAAAGTYSVYKSYFSVVTDCKALRTSLLQSMDRALPPDTMRALMAQDFADFSTHCASQEPEAMTAFKAVMQVGGAAAAQPGQVAAASVVPAVSMARVMPALPEKAPSPAAAPRAEAASAGSESPSQQGVLASIPIGVFGVSAAGTAQGWVPIDRRDADHFGELNFGGYDPSQPLAAGTIMSATWAVPVWREPQAPGPLNISRVQGRLARGNCVRVLSTQMTIAHRLWADVEPAPCAQTGSR
jgi:hypothetical protein